MSSPSSWLEKDVEKGEIDSTDLDERIASPTDGGTTLADDHPQPPESEDLSMNAHCNCSTLTGPPKPRVSRQWTDRVKETVRQRTLSWPEKLKPAKYDENLQSIQRSEIQSAPWWAFWSDSRSVDFHPHGYPRLAAYINSDENVRIISPTSPLY